jgi:hypothetical protein
MANNNDKRKKIYIPIDQDDVDKMNKLVKGESRPFTWVYDEVEVMFYREEGMEHEQG